MSNDLNQHFMDELDVLRQLGKELASESEAAARLAEPNYDPDAERLLESFAFLMGRLRQESSEAFPEILYPLTNQIFPHALRPVPSFVTVQFDSKNARGLQFGSIIEQKTFVDSSWIQIAESNAACQFRFSTRYEVQVLPFALRDEEIIIDGSRLKLTLHVQPAADLRRLLPPQETRRPRLRLSLHGSSREIYELYWGLRGYRRIVARIPGTGIEISSTESADLALRSLGHDPLESILPYPAQSFLGHRHIHEYLLYPEKHLFFDLEGLELLGRRIPPDAPPAKQLEIEIELKPAAYSTRGSTADSLSQARNNQPRIRLGCTPAVNLFSHPSASLHLDGKHLEYPLRAEGVAAHYDIFSVERVTRVVVSGGRYLEEDIRSFDHHAPRSDAGEHPMYQVRPRPALPSAAESYRAAQMYLAIVDPAGRPSTTSSLPLLSVNLLATNRDLPSRYLREGDICRPSIALPEGIKLTSLGRPSPAQGAMLGGAALWRLFKLLSRGFTMSVSTQSLRELLDIYGLYASGAGQTRLRHDALRRSIHRTTLRSRARLLGTPPTMIPGAELHLEMADNAFAHPGQLLMFGHVLGHFLADSSTINTYTKLSISTPSIDSSQLEYQPLIGNLGTLGAEPALESHENG